MEEERKSGFYECTNLMTSPAKDRDCDAITSCSALVLASDSVSDWRLCDDGKVC
jgi:hypothetical protein